MAAFPIQLSEHKSDWASWYKEEQDGFSVTVVYDFLEEWIEKGLWVEQQYYYDLDAVVHGIKDGLQCVWIKPEAGGLSHTVVPEEKTG